MSETYLYSLLGGVLIGLASAGMMFTNGRILGVSGILGGTLVNKSKELYWRIAFLLGLILGGFMIAPVGFTVMSQQVDRPLMVMVIGGLLVGFGTTIGNGCTSGHGVCGVARLSNRSLIATATFIVFGVLSVAVINFLQGRG